MPSIECSMNSLSSFSIKRTLLSIWLFILTLMLSNRLHPVSPVSALLPYSLYFLTAWLVFPRSCIWPCRKARTHPRDATTDGKWPVPVFLSLSPFRSSTMPTFHPSGLGKRGACCKFAQSGTSYCRVSRKTLQRNIPSIRRVHISTHFSATTEMLPISTREGGSEGKKEGSWQ